MLFGTSSRKECDSTEILQVSKFYYPSSKRDSALTKKLYIFQKVLRRACRDLSVDVRIDYIDEKLIAVNRI